MQGFPVATAGFVVIRSNRIRASDPILPDLSTLGFDTRLFWD